MKILTRYVLREFLVPLGYCLAGFVSIYVLFELFGSFSRIVDSELSFGEIVGYFLGYLSPYFMYLAPAALMLATLYTMWSFCHHSEITAMRASGISFLAIVKPLLAVAVLMAAFVAWVNESYVPFHAQAAKQLRNEKFDLRQVSRVGRISYRNARAHRMWTVERAADGRGSSLEGVKVIQDRPDGSRERNILAARAEYLDGEWWLTDAKVHHFDANGREIPSPTPALDALGFRVFPELRERPGDILLQNRDWQYNSVRGKFRYIRTHRDLSEESRREYLYDAWAQLMAPLACLVITLFAIPAGIASGRQSVFKGILGALAMFFGYYGLMIGGMIFANQGWLAPVPAATLPVLVFLVLGIRSFRRQR